MPDRSTSDHAPNAATNPAEGTRSKLEDRAMAVGLVALGAALPIYEQVSERVRAFHASRPGRVLGATARTALTFGYLAADGIEKLRGRGESSEAEFGRSNRAA